MWRGGNKRRKARTNKRNVRRYVDDVREVIRRTRRISYGENRISERNKNERVLRVKIQYQTIRSGAIYIYIYIYGSYEKLYG